MSLEPLLQRAGLLPELRLLVITAVAIWRADWPELQQAAELGRQRGQPRADFEEVLLQAVLFCGFPRVVTAFEQLESVWPATTPPGGGGLPPAEQAAAGRALFAGIYGRNTQAVHSLLAGFHQEFHDFVLQAAYGRILTRPHLDATRRELLAVAMLAAQGQERQLLGHARGARNFGATDAQLHEVLVTALRDEAAATSWFARVR